MLNQDTITLIGNSSDTIGPELVSLSFSSASYVYGDTIEFTVVARDTGSGVKVRFLDFQDSRNRTPAFIPCSGYLFNDSMVYKCMLPKWGEDGDWKLSQIQLRDSSENNSYYYDSIDFNGHFAASGMILDTSPPSLISITLSETYANRGDSILVRMEVYDSISGTYNFYSYDKLKLHFSNSQYQQGFTINYFVKVPGTNIYEAKFKVNEFAINGPWVLRYAYTADSAGNRRNWYPNQLDFPLNAQDTFYVIPDSSHIVQGHVLTSTGAPLENSRVYMVKVVPVDSILISFRTAYTDVNGDYQFNSELRDSVVYFKAVPNDTFYVDEMPTYLDTAWLFANARVVRIDSQLTIIDTFSTLQGFNIGGHGFVHGHIYSGAGKISAQMPVTGQTLVLVDANNKPIAFATTNAMGEYRFENIPDGNYRLFADWPGIDNNTAPTITITPDEFSLNDFDYEVVGNSLMRITVGFAETSAATDAGFTVYPNPVQGKFLISVSAKNDAALSFKLIDVNGKHVKGVAAHQVSSSLWEISAGLLPNGNYFLSITEGNNSWQLPILVVE